MPNPYHDEEGKFASKDEMTNAVVRLLNEGKLDEAKKLAKEFSDIERGNSNSVDSTPIITISSQILQTEWFQDAANKAKANLAARPASLRPSTSVPKPRIVPLTTRKGIDIKDTDVLYGETGNFCTVYDNNGASSKGGLQIIDTEFGYLYLDPEGDYSVVDEKDNAKITYPQDNVDNRMKLGSNITGDDILIGHTGNKAVVYDSEPSSFMEGLQSVETEFGTFYLDPDYAYPVARS